MQYETVLLELLSRIQTLEDEVARLKAQLAQLEATPEAELARLKAQLAQLEPVPEPDLAGLLARLKAQLAQLEPVPEPDLAGLLARLTRLEAQLEGAPEAGPKAVPEEPPAEEAEAAAAPGSYSRVSDEMIEQCYQGARQLRLSGGNPQVLAEQVAARTGMNRGSAFIYLYVAERMLDGSVYKRAISARATHLYLDSILRDDGPEGLRRALEALRQHVRYRRSCGHQVDSLEALCERYRQRL